MPPRHRRGTQRVTEGLPPPPLGAGPPGLLALMRALWVWSWENKAVSSVLASVVVLVAAVLLQPSDATMVMRALSSEAHFAMPQLARFVERREMSTIVRAIELGEDYIVVDGGNRVGKSIAIKVAASRLSANRTVRWSVCDEGDTAALVLRRLYGLDTQTTSLLRIISGVAKLAALAPPSVAGIRELVFASDSTGPEPVLVVEMAERLEVKELKSLLDFAKEVVDERRGRFVFVFSPTEKLDTIGDFGSLSRAEVIHVGDLSIAEAMSFILSSGCDTSQTTALYALIGGHLPHLITNIVREYCRNTMSLSDVEGVLFAGIGAQVGAVDRVLGIGSACGGLCGVATKVWPKPEVLHVLLKKHLVVVALRKGVFMGSPLVQTYVSAHCACSAETTK